MARDLRRLGLLDEAGATCIGGAGREEWERESGGGKPRVLPSHPPTYLAGRSGRAPFRLAQASG